MTLHICFDPTVEASVASYTQFSSNFLIFSESLDSKDTKEYENQHLLVHSLCKVAPSFVGIQDFKSLRLHQLSFKTLAE